jgi:four helix bundle protein
MFDHERLDVYQLAATFDATIWKLLPRRGHRALRDQIERASSSVLACIAEGAGRWSPGEKRHFYAIARGSATECVALLDALKNRDCVSDQDYDRCRDLLSRIVQMLSKLSPPAP